MYILFSFVKKNCIPIYMTSTVTREVVIFKDISTVSKRRHTIRYSFDCFSNKSK
jgi:hypothetical protein